MPSPERTRSQGSTRTTDADLIGKAARLHYEFGLTHQQISKILSVSRVKITRLLAQAREIGIVQITVNSDASPYAMLEHEAAKRFGLEEVMIVPSFQDELEQRRAVARGAASYLQRVLRDGMTVTLGFSRTLTMVPDFLVPQNRKVDATFVPLVGGLGTTSDAVNAHESTDRLAQLFGCHREHLHAPAIVGSAEVAAALRDEPTIKRALARAAGADVAIVGLGTPTTTWMLEAGDISRQGLKRLAAAGAVGDIAARFFDADGAPVELDLADRVIGLTLDEIRAIPVRVIAAAGPKKLRALRAALSAGTATILISDDDTVRAI